MIKEGKINKSCVYLINCGIRTSRSPRPTQGCRADDDGGGSGDDDYDYDGGGDDYDDGDGGGGGDDDDYDDDMHLSSGFVRKTVLFEGSRKMSGAVPQLLHTPSCYVQWQFCRKST